MVFELTTSVEPELVDVLVRLPRAVIEAAMLQGLQPARDRAERRLALAKWILASRRRRTRAFKGIRLGEPTWDMILDLYVAQREGRRVDVSGLCLASGVAPTTALRYVDLLVDDELVIKTGDRNDGRRALLDMHARLRDAVEGWLDQSESSLGAAGLLDGAYSTLKSGPLM